MDGMKTFSSWGSRAFGAVAVLILAVAPAKADPVVLTDHGLQVYSFVNITRNGATINQAVGQRSVELSTSPGQKFNAFCIDFDHSGPLSWSVQVLGTDAAPPDDLPSGAQMAYIYEKYGKQSLASSTEAAAIGLALFDFADDGGDGLDTGFFQVLTNDAIRQRADELIDEANLLAAGADPSVWYNAAINGDDPNRGQNLIGQADIPEPATLALLSMGLAGIGIYGWRRNRARAA
jgi:hypothetical protein